MAPEYKQYWQTYRDYAGVPFIRLDKDLLISDLGVPVSTALINFLNAHELFNDQDNPPNEQEKKNLIAIMVGARSILGDLNPYLFIDSVLLLEKSLTPPHY